MKGKPRGPLSKARSALRNVQLGRRSRNIVLKLQNRPLVPNPLKYRAEEGATAKKVAFLMPAALHGVLPAAIVVAVCLLLLLLRRGTKARGGPAPVRAKAVVQATPVTASEAKRSQLPVAEVSKVIGDVKRPLFPASAKENDAASGAARAASKYVVQPTRGRHRPQHSFRKVKSPLKPGQTQKDKEAALRKQSSVRPLGQLSQNSALF